MKILIFTLSLLLSAPSWAGLAKALECHSPLKRNNDCTLLLIGTIDSLEATGKYCPDGNTSYNYVIESWVRELKKNPDLLSVPTYYSVYGTLLKLGLGCKNN
jgi:hypothetical protein